MSNDLPKTGPLEQNHNNESEDQTINLSDIDIHRLTSEDLELIARQIISSHPTIVDINDPCLQTDRYLASQLRHFTDGKITTHPTEAPTQECRPGNIVYDENKRSWTRVDNSEA